MESAKSPMRAKIPLIKGRVSKLDPFGFTIQFEGFHLDIKCNMTGVDIRLGDIQTAYTEVLFRQQGAG